MIGPRIRTFLRAVAWIVISFAPLMLFFSFVEANATDFTVFGSKWQFWLGMIWSALLPVVHGGVLLSLLSIDERFQNRNALAYEEVRG